LRSAGRSERRRAIGCQAWWRARSAKRFPWGTLVINVTGSFVIGFFGALTGPDGRVFVGSTARQFVMVGMCGGYTTFSSFSLQTLNLMNDGEWLQAGANIGLSVLLCMIAVWAGVVLAGSINAMR
jgi:fluoride exporter